jgi:hypothetical protein
LISRKLLKVVRIDLKHFWKRYKRNKKTEKEKEEKKRKYEKGQGAPFRPRLEASPWPNKAPSRIGTSLSSLSC